MQFGAAGDISALAHYLDPAYYTRAYQARRDDVAFYVKKAVALGGPVLEYGVGNGRVALELARAGLRVTGVDLAKPMLADFRTRLKSEPSEVRKRVTLKYGDMRRVALKRRFPLVIAPFNTILHLYERRDLELFFERVRAHLEPRGHFVFDFSIPMAGDLCRDPERSFGSSPFRHPSAGQVVRYAERFDYDALRQVLLIWMEFSPKDGSASWCTPLTQRQFFPREMEALLHYNGFENIRFGAEFSDDPADRYVDSISVDCTPRARRSARR